MLQSPQATADRQHSLAVVAFGDFYFPCASFRPSCPMRPFTPYALYAVRPLVLTLFSPCALFALCVRCVLCGERFSPWLRGEALALPALRRDAKLETSWQTRNTASRSPSLTFSLRFPWKATSLP